MVRARELGLARWPEVMRLLEQGRGFAAHAALRKVRSGTLGGERERIDAALADQRVFAEAVGKPPHLQRVNGIGTGMYGGSAHDREDGTYVKTRFLSLVFVPVFPLDQWLVRDAREGWYFLAKLPLSTDLRIVRGAVGALCGAGVLWAAGAIWWACTHSDLHLVNGLGVDAEVTIDDLPPVTVHPNERQTLGIASGKHRFRCTVAGRTIDESEADVSGTADLVVYNVAGAAPLYVEGVVYTSDKYPSLVPGLAPSNTLTCLAGDAFVQLAKVDFVFKDPPRTISMKSSKKSETRSTAGVGDGGWQQACGMALETNAQRLAGRIAENVAGALPDDPDTIAAALLWVGAAVGEAEVPKAAARIAAKAPESIPARRALQDARLAAGEHDAALADARGAHLANPSSPQLAALYARLAPNEDALPLVEGAMRAAGADPLVLEMAFRVHARARVLDAAARDAEGLLVRPGAASDALLAGMVRVLAANGNRAAALEALDAALRDEQRFTRIGILAIAAYARTLAASGGPSIGRTSPGQHLERLARLAADGEEDGASGGNSGLSPEAYGLCAMLARDAQLLAPVAARIQAPARRAVDVALLCWTDPAAACADLAKPEPAATEMLDLSTLIVLGAECGASGQTTLAEKLHRALPPWLHGTFDDPEFGSLPDPDALTESMWSIEVQGALFYAHARRERDPGRRAALESEARRLDPLSEVHAW